MSKRQFSFQKYWEDLSGGHVPLLSFSRADDYESWSRDARAKLLELLGPFPERCDLAAEVEYSVDEGDFIRERVVFDSEENMSVPCILLIPKSDHRGRAVICCHGHGRFGKDPVTGIVSSPEYQADIDLMNYDYARQMALHGFITLSPDLRGFGERRDGDDWLGRDTCNVNFLKGALLGVYPLTLNIFDIMRCVDYLETRSEVDCTRIGMMGLSQGGTMTAFVSALEPRIRAADIIAYVNPFHEFAVRRGNFCGSQMVPSLYRGFDTSDIASLAAPRPLLLEMGIYDSCFFFKDMVRSAREVAAAYEAAGCPQRLEYDIHPGPHAFSGARAFDFFERWL